MMYGKFFDATPEVMDKDFVVPIGKAKVERQGTDCTIVTFSKMVGVCLEVAEMLQKEGINCEVKTYA